MQIITGGTKIDSFIEKNFLYLTLGKAKRKTIDIYGIAPDFKPHIVHYSLGNFNDVTNSIDAKFIDTFDMYGRLIPFFQQDFKLQDILFFGSLEEAKNYSFLLYNYNLNDEIWRQIW